MRIYRLRKDVYKRQGGGMAGILIAYFLEQAGVDYMLVEGKTIGDGITKKTTAKITSQHLSLIHIYLHNEPLVFSAAQR